MTNEKQSRELNTIKWALELSNQDFKGNLQELLLSYEFMDVK